MRMAQSYEQMSVPGGWEEPWTEVPGEGRDYCGQEIVKS